MSIALRSQSRCRGQIVGFGCVIFCSLQSHSNPRAWRMAGRHGQVNPPNIPLFRKEALEHRADRLHGDVHAAVPVS